MNPLKMTPKQIEEQAEKMARLLKMAMEEMDGPMHADKMRFYAVEQWTRFDALKKVGFTDAQAIELVKGHK